MKNILWFVIFVLGGLVVTNPSYDTHKNKINQEVKADHPLIGKLGAGKLVSALTNYNNYFLFSTTELDGDVVSYGVLTVVVVKDLEDI